MIVCMKTTATQQVQQVITTPTGRTVLVVSAHGITAGIVMARGFDTSLAHDITQAHAARMISDMDWSV